MADKISYTLLVDATGRDGVDDRLKHSMFYEVLFPPAEAKLQQTGNLCLRQTLRYRPDLGQRLAEVPWVVLDFETTGLKAAKHEIVEIGALKYVGNKKCDQYSQLIQPAGRVTWATTRITGLTAADLQDQPYLCKVMDEFLQFIRGSVLVAHNAEFDASFLRTACDQHGWDFHCPIYCTLKMARQLLPDLERRTLDALAEHYGLSFSSRHRSIGDAEVTAQVFASMLDLDTLTLDDLQDWRVQ